jgi:cell wall-associated NlpC family hydrolase
VAISSARRLRPVLALAALVAATATIAPAVAAPAPRDEPSISSVQKQLGELTLKNTQLVEKFDQAQVTVQHREKAADAARQVAAKADAAYRAAHAQFTQVIQAQYESGSLGAAAALLDSSSDNNYLERLATLNLISTHLAQVVRDVTTSRTTAQSAASKAAALLATARTQRSELAQQRQTVQTQISKYRHLLAKLNAQQRAAYLAEANPSVSPQSLQHMTAAGTGAARRAVQFALDQVGKPYVFGAAGPGAYDCSGLTMAAWQRGGVSLPHSAADQYNYGHHVNRDELEPGDLIFFYQPIGHVTIYIGDGLMVSAPTEGEPVSVVPLSSFLSDYVGATRLT